MAFPYIMNHKTQDKKLNTMLPKRFFVTGISTEIGKTVISAILTEALQADYWKPVQSGDLHHTDTDKVKALISNIKSVFHEEAYRLHTPASPHYAAAVDGIRINLTDMVPPSTNNHLIVEGAGGLLVPLNDEHLIIDLIQHLAIPTILVSQNYLGSINHTLLSVEALQKRGIPIEGIIFNGEKNEATESIILHYSACKCLGRVNQEASINQKVIQSYAQQFEKTFLV